MLWTKALENMLTKCTVTNTGRELRTARPGMDKGRSERMGLDGEWEELGFRWRKGVKIKCEFKKKKKKNRFS